MEEMAVETSHIYWQECKGVDAQCPECSAWSKVEDWKSFDGYCEDCGEHPCILCPQCKCGLDTIYTHELPARATIILSDSIIPPVSGESKQTKKI